MFAAEYSLLFPAILRTPLGSPTVPPQNCRLRACRPVALGSHGTSDNVNPNTKLVCLFLCPVIVMTLAASSRRGSEAKRHSLGNKCVNREGGRLWLAVVQMSTERGWRIKTRQPGSRKIHQQPISTCESGESMGPQLKLMVEVAGLICRPSPRTKHAQNCSSGRSEVRYQPTCP